jgi:hypothetical protein
MPRERFSSRSTGVLFWGAGYLIAAIAWGLVLAALWPQGSVCTTTCGDRIEAGAIAIVLLIAGGLAGLVVAIWLGVSRRTVAPRLLVFSLLGVLVASLATAVVVVRSGSSQSEHTGLMTARATWSWALAVPASALIAMSLAAGLRDRMRARRARIVASARPRRA